MGLIMPRPKGIEFSREREIKKSEAASRFQVPEPKGAKVQRTWKGRKAGGEQRSRSESGAPTGFCWPEAPLVLCGEEEKHCGVIQRYLQTSPRGSWSKFLKQRGQ